MLLFSPAGDIHILLKQLVLFGYDEQAGALQQVLEEVLQLMETSIPEIWTPDLQQSSVSSVCAHPQYPSCLTYNIKYLAVFCIHQQRVQNPFALQICSFFCRGKIDTLQYLPSQYTLGVYNRYSPLFPLH